MLILTGSNLGQRQRELNTKVHEAASNNVDFEQVKDTAEKSDVDKLFKIDLASKYMNIEYIIEVLKSGDSLYVSRALKCVWVYDDEFSNFINVDNLHNNVIPFMSTKMKKKLLSAISTYVRNEDRAAAFYKYCMDMKLISIALKFLNFTSDNFKFEVLKDSSNCKHLITGLEGENVKRFVGLSFTLADAYVAIFHITSRINAIRSLSYLYSVSDVKYLFMLEKYVVLSPYNQNHLGIRISRSIMKKHKNRVLNHPTLYVPLLNKNVLARYSTVDDAKIYLAAVLPNKIEDFWNINYCNTYKFLIDKLPDKKFEFIKTIFTAKYPEEKFEMSFDFYDKQYYEFMTAEERDAFALKHIASGSEILGIGKDYIWYKFVNFEKAFEEIKKLVMITPDISKRAEMVKILIESAKNQRDVEKLLKHYYERHINEQRYIKENFVDRVIQYFNVYEFDDDCWMALNKIFHSLEVYSLTDYHNCKSDYKIIALIYDIINNKDVHEAIKLYIRTNMYFYSLKMNTNKLPKEQEEMVFHYLFQFYTDEIRKFENVPYDDDVKNRLRKYIHFVLDLLDQYNRTKNDCPELVQKFMKLDWLEFKFHRLIHEKADITPKVDLMRYLKEDAKLLVKNLPLVKTNIDNTYTLYNMSHLLKKLKIYFSNDIAKDYLKFFDSLLTEEELWRKTAQTAIHGIFQLGNENFKVDFMTKYAPLEPKINHSEINVKLLRIQEAICAHACYSRPPVPLKYMLMYIKGDYVHFCLPMFHAYLANLPQPLCIEFIEAILNKPVSIQKHGIRLAFQCFNADTLKKLVLHAWKKTKNVSLRMIIFKVIFNKIAEDKDAQDVLFSTLKTITLTLHQDDDDEVFGLLTSYKLPSHLVQEYIEIVWKVVSQLPKNNANLKRMSAVIEYMDGNINLIRQDAIREIVDDFITTVFSAEEIGVSDLNYEASALNGAKWNLTATFIIYTLTKEDLETKLKLTKSILRKCLGPLEVQMYEKKYLLRQLCFNFILDMECKSYRQDLKCYENVNIVMKFILNTLQDTLTIEEMYSLVWKLRLGIVARNVIIDAEMKYGNEETLSDYAITNIAINFAKGIGNLIEEFVKKEIYFASFSQDIKNNIDVAIQTVKQQLKTENTSKNMLVIVALELMKFEMFEIYLLVLDLLPVNSALDDEDYKSIIYKIKKLDNKEIRCNLYMKFVNSEFKVRELIHSETVLP